jgi:alpha-glucosidase
MYDGVVLDDKLEVGEVMRKVVGLRYRLAPTFYSLYVVHYHRNAWPVLKVRIYRVAFLPSSFNLLTKVLPCDIFKPMLWYHSADHQTLQLDTQFIFGSHILVAPVLENGARSKRVYMPTSSSDEASRGGRTWWCEIDTGIWHYAYDSEIGRWVTIGENDSSLWSISEYILIDACPNVLDAPLNRTPVLVRGGAIVVYGGLCTNGIADGRNVREAVIFAVPSVDTSTSIDDSRNTTPIPRNGTTGTFTLIEDDGFSNDHTRHGYTEINLSFRVISQTLHCTDSATNSNQDSAGAGIPGSKDVVEVDYEIVHAGYALPYDTITFRLPEGDSRTIVPAFGKTLSRSTESREGAVMRISV